MLMTSAIQALPWVLIASYRRVGMAAVWCHEFRTRQPTRRDTECR
jgi:hypothetical protein